ncbi:uncharacterized protein [Dysidea avara]|uniref:uncharacterized protein isoform X2 n=1 Tax=Dysidea avara TaxID=196820 RepID=UPI003318D9CE
MSTPHVITLSAVNSSVFVSVTAYNDFGSGGASLAALDDIMSSSVQGTTSVLLEGDTPAETYNVAVVCDISPSSTADYCEAIARNDANTVSASATLNNNDMATANLNGLVCEEMYSIIAGGVITNVAMMDQTLVGPRFHMETITAPACPVGIQTTSVSTVSITVTSTIAIALPPGRSGGSGDNSGAIIGIVVGGICAAMIVVVAIVILIYCCCCRKDDKKSYTVEMHAVGPTHESVQPPLSDEVQMDTNPAYAVSTAGTVKMEGNPAYQTMTTNPGGGVGRELYYYEDIINDRNVKMTQNPAYAVP